MLTPPTDSANIPSADVKLSCHREKPCDCPDFWSWSSVNKSHEVRLYGEHGNTAHFHPNWSNGTAAVRSNKVLNGSIYYWEVHVSNRVFGTSMMFGIGTSATRLHVNAFINLLGENQFSMGLSHKGIAWFNGTWKQFTKPFRENEATTIGMLFNGINGTLSYFKDGQPLGVAFTGLDRIKENLYPIISSTAAKTEMTLLNTRRCYTSLQDRCGLKIIHMVNDSDNIEELPLPKHCKELLKEEYQKTKNADKVIKCGNQNN